MGGSAGDDEFAGLGREPEPEPEQAEDPATVRTVLSDRLLRSFSSVKNARHVQYTCQRSATRLLTASASLGTC